MRNTNLIPSVCKIFFAPLSDINAISSTTDRFHRYVEFVDGKSWQQMYFTQGTAEFSEKSKDTESGEIIEQSLKFIFPGEDENNLASLDAIVGRPLAVKIQYSSGLMKLMGDVGNGVKLAQVNQISAKASGSQMEFSCMAAIRACWITP